MASVKILGWASPELKLALMWFISTRAFLTAVGVLARSRIEWHPLSMVSLGHPWLDIWGAWDSVYYLRLAAEGFAGVEPLMYKFSPLYPALIRLIQAVAQDYVVSAVLVSNACLIASAVLLYRLVRPRYGEDIAKRAVMFLFVFPGSFYLSAILSESLFLVLLLAAFLSSNAGNMRGAGMSGFLLSLTRVIGVLAVFPLAWEYVRGRRDRGWGFIRGALPLLLMPLGLAAYLAYIWLLTGNPLGYFSIQQGYWGTYNSNPIEVLYRELFDGYFLRSLNSLIAILTLAVVAAAYRRLGLSYVVLSLLMVLFPLATGNINMILHATRYATVAFPAYIALALLIRGGKWELWAAMSLFYVQCLLMALWTVGYQ
jgi:hypothetical protein